MKYDVQYKIGNLAYTGWLTDVVVTDEIFRGTPGMTYTFQVRIRDGVGNQSDWVQSSVVAVSKVTKYYSFGASRVAMRQGSVVYYLHGDHLGSTSLTTDQGGALVSQARYLPYGEERWTNGASPTDFTFTSQRSDGFGLMDYNARYYSQVLGRFISPDSIVPEPGGSQGWNRYAYAMNNPIRYTDPSGHCIVQYSGDVRMGQGPHGTSGLCSHTESPHAEAADAASQLHNDPNQVSITIPDGTLSVNVGETASVFGHEFSVSIGIIHIDEKGNIAAGTTTWGYGGTTVLGISAGADVMYTNAADLSGLGGTFVNSGLALPLGKGGTNIDSVFGQGRNGNITGFDLGAGYGPQLPDPFKGKWPSIGIHTNANYTPDQAIFTSKVNEDGTRTTCLNIFSGCSLSTFKEEPKPEMKPELEKREWER